MGPFADPVVAPRPASTVIAVRQGSALEVLMVRRSRRSAFMGGAHVFPGGGVDAIDGIDLALSAVRWEADPEEFAWRAAALRELAEEAGIVLADRRVDVAGESGRNLYRAVVDAGAVLDAHRLHYLSNWVTPLGVSKRFDTRFYVAVVDAGTGADADGFEVFDASWVEPATALQHGREGMWQLEFPTRAHLELLSDLGDVEAVVEYARSARPQRVEPRLARSADGSVTVLLPGDPEYAGAGGAG